VSWTVGKQITPLFFINVFLSRHRYEYINIKYIIFRYPVLLAILSTNLTEWVDFRLRNF